MFDTVILQIPIAEIVELLAFDTEAQASEFCERSECLVSQSEAGPLVVTLVRSEARFVDEWNFRRSHTLIECKFLNRTFGEVFRGFTSLNFIYLNSNTCTVFIVLLLM